MERQTNQIVLDRVAQHATKKNEGPDEIGNMIQEEGEERREKSGRGNKRSSKIEMENLYGEVDNLEKVGRKNVSK